MERAPTLDFSIDPRYGPVWGIPRGEAASEKFAESPIAGYGNVGTAVVQGTIS